MFIGIDLGTSSIKTILIDENQKTIGSATNSIELLNPVSGFFEQNPESWLTATLKCFLHKIVGLAFLENDDFENKYIIDHLDDNIFNYLPNNLEWVTPSENSNRIYRRGRR